MSKPSAHPYAELFPMMTGAELDALAADIAEVGLRQPIVRYGGAILDGRNRLLACEKAGIEPAFTEYEGDDAGALALVISLNIQRRDLTSAQKAIVAARRWGLDGYSKGGRPEKGKPVETPVVSLKCLAKQFKVSEKSILQARDLLAEAPDLAAEVEGCTSSLAAAYQSLQDRRKEAAQKAQDAERISGYKDAVSNGEMTVDDALQKAIEEEREEKEKKAAEADARQNWLKELAALLKWVEVFIAQRTDEHLEWYTVPDSPGLFDHGITEERVAAAAAQLDRVRAFTFGGK